MPARPVGVADAVSGATTAEIDVIERASPDLFTTTTADPGTAGTTLAVTLRDRFPQSGTFKIHVRGTSGIAEVMLVTGGWGTGAGSFTVTRAQDGTAGVAHSIGARVSQVVGVQRVEPVDAGHQVSYMGRTGTFRTPGRAGTTGQKLFALHNATGSTVNADLEKVDIDVVATVIKAVTVLPPVIKAVRFTAVPTNGTALAKVPEDTSLSSNAALTAWGDASADGTLSATALTIAAIANGATPMVQEFAPRLITAAGYEMFDKTTFFSDESVAVTLRPLEGVAIFLDYVLATQNVATDMYTVSARWTEYTQA